MLYGKAWEGKKRRMTDGGAAAGTIQGKGLTDKLNLT
jgi:hypothetical protein